MALLFIGRLLHRRSDENRTFYYSCDRSEVAVKRCDCRTVLTPYYMRLCRLQTTEMGCDADQIGLRAWPAGAVGTFRIRDLTWSRRRSPSTSVRPILLVVCFRTKVLRDARQQSDLPGFASAELLSRGGC
jgi:hypothetical protein